MNNKANRKKITLITSIFIIALVIRITYSLLMASTFTSSGPWGDGIGYNGDSHLYHRIAYNIYKGNGFSGSFSAEAYGIPLYEVNQFKPLFVRGPMYPLFVSFVYKCICDKKDMESTGTWINCWNRVRIVQSFLDAVVCLLVFYIVRLIYPASFWPAIIAAGLHAFNVYNILFTKDLMSTTMDTFLLVSVVLLYIKALIEKKNRWWVSSGMLLGMLVLSRPEYVLSIFLMAAFIFFVSRDLKYYALKKAAIFIISAFIVIAPWAIRNYAVFKKPILVSTGLTGYSLFVGTWWSHDTWKWGNFPEKVFENEVEEKAANDVRRDWVWGLNTGTIEITKFDDKLLKFAVDRIWKHPVKVFRTWITRIPGLWWQNYIQLFPTKWPHGIYFIFYFVFAVYAFFSGKRGEKILMWPVGLLFIYLSLMLLPFAVTPRYGTALIPGIISLAGIGIWKAILHFKSMLATKKV